MDFTASNGTMINWRSGRRNYPEFCLKGLRKTTIKQSGRSGRPVSWPRFQAKTSPVTSLKCYRCTSVKRSITTEFVIRVLQPWSWLPWPQSNLKGKRMGWMEESQMWPAKNESGFGGNSFSSSLLLSAAKCHHRQVHAKFCLKTELLLYKMTFNATTNPLQGSNKTFKKFKFQVTMIKNVYAIWGWRRSHTFTVSKE
jgi:hypothetical protein